MRQARISIVDTHRQGISDEDEVILARAVERIQAVGRDRPDLVLLPEVFANHSKEKSLAGSLAAAQTATGPISEEMATLARRYETYIAFGLLRRSDERCFNSLVLLDRHGQHVWTYDKIAPTNGEMAESGVTPGAMPQAFDCDFGRIGGAICFDINFAELAEIYIRQDVELVLFSSAFPAGRLLDAWVVRYGFAIAASTWYHRNRIIDCTDATVARTSDYLPYATAPLNLNRRVVHMDGNMEKLDRMRTRYAGDVIVDDLRDEAVCVITSLKEGLEVADLIEEYEVEKLPDYFDRSRRLREERGGLPVPRWW